MEVTKKWIMSIAMTAALTAAFAYAPFMGGCNTMKLKPVVDPLPHVEAAKTTVKAVADQLPVRAQKIETSTSTIQQAVPAPIVQKLMPSFGVIRDQTQGIRDDATQLQTAVVELQTTKTQVTELKAANGTQDATIEKQAKQIEQLQDEDRKNLQRVWTLLIVIGVIGIGISAAMVITGEPRGVMLGIVSAGVLGTSLTLAAYGHWIAIGGVGVLVLAVAWVGYQLLIKHKAVTELVSTVQIAKDRLSDEAKAVTFRTPTAAGVQSDTTEAMVAKVKQSLASAT